MASPHRDGGKPGPPETGNPGEESRRGERARDVDGKGDQEDGGTKKEAAPKGGFCEVKAVFAYLRRRKINSAAAPRPNSAKLPGSGIGMK